MALDLLESTKAPRKTLQTPYIWSHGDKWKELYLTKEQPMLDEKGTEEWKKAKKKYRKLKKEGKV